MSKEPSETKKNSVKLDDLYQIQMDGLKKGWLIYPHTLNPLVLTIEKKKTRAN